VLPAVNGAAVEKVAVILAEHLPSNKIESLDKTAFKDLNKEDLVATDIEFSKILGIPYAGNECE
jgi:hypothetical protein